MPSSAPDGLTEVAPAARAADKAPAKVPAKSLPQRAMEKLGLLRDIDLALHLPLRYEDETKLTPIAEARPGISAQVVAEIVDSDVKYRPSR